MRLSGWRERWRGKLRWELGAKAVVANVTDRIPVRVRAGRVNPGRLTIETTAQRISHEELQLDARQNRSALALDGNGQASTIGVGVSADLQIIGLISGEQVAPTGVAIEAFNPKATWFSFIETRRSEPPSLFAAPASRRPTRVVGPVKTPPPPPEALREGDLRERLRWMLTPPINELIADPQLALPFAPFPFQTLGIKWLYDRESALLADEMGLGKTMQAIIAGRLLWREGLVDQILVVCPKQLISNWKEEIRLWWPQANQSIMVSGNDRQWFLRIGTPNVIFKIINYESIAREADWLKDQKFAHGLIIIDEAQRIKNPDTKQSRAVKALRAHRRWALTGTPLENRAGDLLSIFEFVRPGLLESDAPEYLRRSIGPYILRRRAEEVLQQLPEKSEVDIQVELSSQHADSYRQMECDGVLDLKAKGDSITVTHVFALITKLRQICNFDPVTGESAKLERLMEDLSEVAESGRKALIFSQFVSADYGLRRLAFELSKQRMGVVELHGQVPPQRRDAVIREFRENATKGVMLLNFAVGGVGLNLQAANYVFLFDRWWNPAVEDQAIKRAHRIGQTQKVFVRRFYCKDTIEERILQKLREKRRLFRAIIDEAEPEADSLGLTEQEIFSLFDLTVRPRTKGAGPGPPRLIWSNLSPQDFELLVAQAYEKQGYSVTHTGGSHDGGVDVEAVKLGAASTERIVIQCKRQQRNVGRPDLHRLWGVVNADPSITRGVVVSSSDFTPEAKGFAYGKRLTLIDGRQLRRLSEEFGVALFA